MRSREIGVVLILLLSAGPSGASVAEAAPLDTDQLAAGIADRAAFGLRADPAYVYSLMSSADDAGTAEWGIPLTVKEMLALDLPARMEFRRAATEVLAYARSTPEFAGAYMDQPSGGHLVLQFTSIPLSTSQQIAKLAPKGMLDTRTETVQHSFERLQAALFAAPTAAARLAPEVQLASVGIDEPHNGLSAVLVGQGIDQSLLAASLADELGVPIAIDVAGDMPAAHACTARNVICSPAQPGIWAATANAGCTLGFHVVNGSGDKQFVTSGHCSDQAGESRTWYQPSPSWQLLGDRTANLYVPGNYTEDIQRVQMPNTLATKRIYGEGTRDVIGWDWAVTGDAVCTSLGHRNTNDCGTVTVGNDIYNLEGYLRVGTKTTGITTQGGDSGSPLYLRGQGWMIGVGIYSAGNSTDRWWARFGDGITSWSGWDIYH